MVKLSKIRLTDAGQGNDEFQKSFNNTAAVFPQDQTISDLFDEQVGKDPDSIALEDDSRSLTYREVSAESNALASFIQSQNIEGNSVIGLLLDNSIEAVIAILGVLKSGNAYLPIDPDNPFERVKLLLNDTKAPLLISQKKHIRSMNRLQWECPSVKKLLCLDTDDFWSEIEPVNELGRKDLWNYIGENAHDDISGGAWFSSYTGEDLSREEMDEYAQNILEKLNPHLNKDTRVLEIGCSSGISMFKIAPQVGLYYGTDLSNKILEKTKADVKRSGLDNIRLKTMPAHEVHTIDEKDFDIIILNSVVQCFNGHNYLNDVLQKAIKLLNNKGHIFIGDIQDLDTKEDLLQSIYQFEKGNKNQNHKIKNDWSNELFLSREYFNDIFGRMDEVASVAFSGKIGTLSNELTLYRYDAILTIDKLSDSSKKAVSQNRFQFDNRALEKYDNVPVHSTAKPDDLAYIIYTSGSTGNPKGCMITHKNVVRLIKNDRHPFDFLPSDIWVLAHAYNFDFSVWEIFGPLLYGGKLLVPARSLVKDISRFATFIKENGVTVLNQTPLAFRYLSEHVLAQSSEQGLEALRFVIFGGDRLEPARLANWIKSYPLSKVQLVNMYGITETTVHVTYHRLTEEDITSPAKGSPIGVPIPETTVYICNQDGELVPSGVIGELYVGGSGVCKGYLNNETLTQQRFVEMPALGEGKFYRTGDKGRWLDNGTIEFFGRIDNQVKVRGYRIELGEIENTINVVPGVKQASVFLTDEGEDAKLQAAVILGDEDNHVIKQLLAYQNEHPELLKQLFDLPNGMMFFHKNKSETLHVFQEIFEHHTYTKHGVNIKEGDVIFDIGANIGMFTVYAGFAATDARIYAFEPIPDIYECLEANARLYPFDIQTHNIGFSNKKEEVTFAYYPQNTVISGKYSQDNRDKEMVGDFLATQNKKAQDKISDKQLEEVLEQTLQSQQVNCQLYRLSDFIEQNNIECIDLLKIDAERSELDILEGIDERHWPVIKQLVVEVQDFDGRLEQIIKNLEDKGFEINSDQDDSLENSNIYNVYARRPNQKEGEPFDKQKIEFNFTNPKLLLKAISQHCSSNLPAYMVPGSIKILDGFPLNNNGKINRKELPYVQSIELNPDKRITAPRNETERTLLTIWEEILDRRGIGVHDNFFESGGHSLKATKVIWGIQQRFEVSLELGDMFAHPTIEELAQLILTADKAEQQDIEPIAKQEDYALSNAQKRLWVINQFESAQIAYNIAGAYFLHSALDKEALEKVFDTLIERHESLRTVFVTVNDEPRQKIIPVEDFNFNISFVDLRNIADAEGKAKQMAEEEAATPFNIEKGPLLRFTLLQLADDQYGILLTMHHIISDGWSMQVFLNELLTVYNAYASGIGHQLAPLKIQYKDFAAWQNDQLQGANLDYHRDYWLEKFSNKGTVLNIPADFPRPAIKTFNGDRVQSMFTKAQVEALNKLSQKCNVSLFMTLQALVKTVLFKYTDISDITVGTVEAGRKHKNLEGQIGYYLDTLPLRTTFDKKDSFDDLLAKVKSTTLEAYEHQVYPFDQLVDDLNLERDASHSPLFDVIIALQNMGLEGNTTEQGTIPITAMDRSFSYTKYDLTIIFHPDGDNLHLVIEFNTDLYKKQRALRMIDHFQHLVDVVVARPEEPLSSISLLSSSDQTQILETFNQPSKALAAQPTLIALFEESIKNHESFIAIEDGEVVLSYRELNDQAKRLASYLINDFGVNVNDHVALMCERSYRSVVASLAIWKAGAVLVPIDPLFPSERVKYILNQTRAKALLTEMELLAEIDYYDGNVFALDIQLDQLPLVEHELSTTNDSNASAYILFTSGSTGVPKGVEVSHNNLINYLNWANEYYFQGERGHNMPFFTPITFDLTLTSIFSTLLRGDTLKVYNEHEAVDNTLKSIFDEQSAIKAVKLTPSHVTLLSHMGLSTTAVDTVILGGEALTGEVIKALRKINSEIKIYNEYGPTETTIGSSVKQISDVKEIITIGTPIDNTHIYILGTDNHLQPIGIPGEICIAGAGVSKGYLGEHELTEKVFTKNTFDENYDTVYHTGDLAQWLENGELLYLGRKDDQIKVRGHRIEPGEISAVLTEHEAIKDCHVQLDGQGENLLVVAIPNPGKSPVLQKLLEIDQAKTNLETLPNGLKINHQNKSETNLIYFEIFEDHTYLKHNIQIKPGDTIFDVGANIGLFSLFVSLYFPETKVYSFEPLPEVFKSLSANANLYQTNITPLNIGLSNKESEVVFDYYPNNTVMSGRYGDMGEEHENVRQYLINQLKQNGEEVLEDRIEELIKERVHSQKVTCKLRKLSDVIKDHSIDQIDLLKIDVEKSEWDVLEGIEEEHWNKIRQIVIEVHDQDGMKDKITAFLRKYDFEVIIDQDEFLIDTNIYNIYAIRSDVDHQHPSKPDEKHFQRYLQYLDPNVLIDELRQLANQKLPSYMRPVDYMLLTELPLTHNGKIDPREIVKKHLQQSGESRSIIAPRNLIEEKLVAIWSEVLETSNISVEDSFFVIGGHSLHGIQVVQRIHEKFGITIGLSNIFEKPTIAQLARFLANQEIQETYQPIEPVAEQEFYELSHYQHRLWLAEQAEQGRNNFNIPSAYLLKGPLEVASFEKALTEIIDRHEVFRTSFAIVNGMAMQKVHHTEELELGLEYLDFSEVQNGKEKAHQLIKEDTIKLFDLSVAPLFLAKMIKLSDQEHLFFYNMHHIVSDGWSMGILAAELIARYNSLLHDNVLKLPKLAIQYKDFAHWQNQQLQGDSLNGHKQFWADQFKGNIPVLDLPTDFPRPQQKTYKGQNINTSINGQHVAQLQDLASYQHSSMFMIMLACVNSLLHTYTGQDDIVVGTSTGGRPHKDLEDQIGFYVNLLPIRTGIDEGESFISLLDKVRANTMAVFEHQAYPFEKIVEDLGVQRDQSRSPLFDAALVFLNFKSEQEIEERFEGLEIEEYPLNFTKSELDIRFTFKMMEKQLYLNVEYAVDLFEEASIQLMIERFKKLIEQIIKSPNSRLKDLDLTLEEENGLKEEATSYDFNF